jgi:iron-sulfur cluster assembly protein
MALPPPIKITEGAATRIRYLLAQRGKESLGVKVGVRTGGCSGLSYTIEYADEIAKFDEVVPYPNKDSEEFKVIIDPKSIMDLIGSEMDFVEEKMKSGFTFQNPNEKGRCGCGESFSV